MPTRKVELASTAARLKQLLAPFDEPAALVITHSRLMEVSEERIHEAARSDVPIEKAVATRILESPKTFRRWQVEHAAIMRQISRERASAAQNSALLYAALALIHRKAMFEYLRDREVRGRDREHLVVHFFRNRDYAKSIASEHGIYIRSAGSFLCSSHVGTKVMLDAVFDEPLLEYEAMYTTYFRAYCDVALGRTDPAAAHAGTFVQLLKKQVNDWRDALLALAHSRSGTWRRPTF